MPNCTATQVPFAKLGRRAIDVRFDGGDVSSDGGLLLLRQVERRLGLLKAVAKVLPDPRNPWLVQHTTEQLLRQRVFGLCQGYEDLNDHDRLRDDLALQTAVGKLKRRPPARPCAGSRTVPIAPRRWPRSGFWSSSSSLRSSARRKNWCSTSTPPTIWSMAIRKGGTSARYYDNYCFLPLYVFCGEQLLVAYLRPAKNDAALHAAAILKLLVTRLRQAWPGVRIIFRGDSGFCRPLLLSWCERNYVHYVVGMAKNSRLLTESEWWREQAARAFAWTQQPQRIFGEFHYRARSWPCHRRMIAKAEHNAQGANPRFVVTNLRDATASALRNDVLRPRRDGEPDQGMPARPVLRSHQLPSVVAQSVPSAARGLAYVLLERLRTIGLAGTELARAQVWILRCRLLKVGAVIVRNTRRIRFFLASAFPHQAAFRLAAQRFATG